MGVLLHSGSAHACWLVCRCRVFPASGCRPAGLKKYGRPHSITQVWVSARPGLLSQLDIWCGQPVGKPWRAILRAGKTVKGPDPRMGASLTEFGEINKSSRRVSLIAPCLSLMRSSDRSCQGRTQSVCPFGHIGGLSSIIYC